MADPEGSNWIQIDPPLSRSANVLDPRPFAPRGSALTAPITREETRAPSAHPLDPPVLADQARTERISADQIQIHDTDLRTDCGLKELLSTGSVR